MTTVVARGIDWAWYTPNFDDPSWEFGGRYFAPNNSKALTPAEAQRFTKAGKSIIGVFETTGTDFTGGRARGQADARAALAEAEACGMPAGRPIYFAIDEVPSDGSGGAAMSRTYPGPGDLSR